MKKLFSGTIFLILINTGYSQIKNFGKYCDIGGYENECIEFLDSNQFKFSSSGCTVEMFKEGRGEYTFRKNVLVLNFDSDSISSSVKELKGRELEKGDSMKIEIHIYDAQYGEYLPMSAVGILNKNNSSLDQNYHSLFTGNKVFYLPVNKDGYNLILEHFLYKRLNYYIQSSNELKLDVFLSPKGSLSGVKRVYTVKRKTKKCLKMQLLSFDSEKYIKYKKGKFE